MIVVVVGIAVLAAGLVHVGRSVRAVGRHRAATEASGRPCLIVYGSSRSLGLMGNLPLATLTLGEHASTLSVFVDSSARHLEIPNERLLLRWKGPTLVGIADAASGTKLYPWPSNRSPSAVLEIGTEHPQLRRTNR